MQDPASPPRAIADVSVVIPVRNDAELLAVCLRALAAQTVRPLEVIVVDNGSSDHTAQVARDFGARVLAEGRIGIGAAASTGYDAAAGAVIARLDADSVPATDWIETAVAAFGENPGVDAVTGGATFHDGPRWLRQVGAAVYLGSYFVATGLALAHSPLFGSNMAMRASAWRSVRDEAHSLDTGMHDDLDLAFHLGPERSIRFLSRMRVRISSRPLTDGAGALRVRRGFRTVLVHWPHDLPSLRLGRRLARALRLGGPRKPSLPVPAAVPASASVPVPAENAGDPARPAVGS